MVFRWRASSTGHYIEHDTQAHPSGVVRRPHDDGPLSYKRRWGEQTLRLFPEPVGIGGVEGGWCFESP